MPDRLVYTLRTAIASNTGGPFVTTWDRSPVTSAGTIRAAVAVAPTISSNARENTVDIYFQSTSTTGASNTATSILVTPITLSNDSAQVTGTISEAGKRVSAGGHLELRTYSDTDAAIPSFTNLVATVEVERD